MGTHVEAPFARCVEQCTTLPRALIEAVSARLSTAHTAEQAWSLGSAYLLEVQAPFDAHAELYTCLAAQVPHGLLPAWSPDADAMEHSNLAQLAKDTGHQTYASLHAWSVLNPDAYWRTTLEALDLRFEEPPHSIRGAPDDAEAPHWLAAAKLNVARACLDGDPHRVVLIASDADLVTEYTQAELLDAVKRAAAGMLRLGITAGDHVAMAVPLGFDAVTGYLALLYLGAVVVCIAESYSEQEIAVRLQITKPKWALTSHVVQRAGKVLPLYDKFKRANAPRAIVIGDPSALSRPGDVSWASLTDNLPDASTLEPYPTPIDAANTVLFSSGTTGTPKAIPWTPGCAIKAAADAKWHLDVRRTDRLLWPTSLGWMMGAWSIFATLLNGAALVTFDDAPTLRGLGELVDTAHVTHLGVVPSLVRNWREARTMEGLAFSSVRLFSSTGECSSPADMLYLMWLARYRPIVEYCGGTEIAGGYVTGTLLSPCVPSCFTTAALGQSFVCLSEAGNEVAEGEAFLTLPSLGLSTSLLNRDHHAEYYEAVPRAGLRRHGDLIQHLDGTYFRVLGRADDTMNLGGVKVSSAEIERVCQDTPGVHELAAIALTPRGGGPSALVLCVVPGEGKPSTEASLLAQLQTHVRERVNPLFRVERIVFLEALPRTASNKVMRRVLRDRYADLLATSSGAVERIVS